MTARVQFQDSSGWHDSGFGDDVQQAVAVLVEKGFTQWRGFNYRIKPEPTYTVTFTETERHSLIGAYYGDNDNPDTWAAAVKVLRNAKADQ